jgi:hypothetical protein
VVLEVVTDPDVPPLPPHITLEQAKKYMSALFKGDSDEAGIIHQSFTELVAKLLPPATATALGLGLGWGEGGVERCDSQGLPSP